MEISDSSITHIITITVDWQTLTIYNIFTLNFTLILLDDCCIDGCKLAFQCVHIIYYIHSFKVYSEQHSSFCAVGSVVRLLLNFCFGSGVLVLYTSYLSIVIN